MIIRPLFHWSVQRIIEKIAWKTYTLCSASKEPVKNSRSEESIESMRASLARCCRQSDGREPEKYRQSTKVGGEHYGDDASGSHHELIPRLRMVYYVRCEAIFSSINFSKCNSRRMKEILLLGLGYQCHCTGDTAIVGKKCTCAHDSEDDILLFLTPVQRIVRIIAGLGYQDCSVVRRKLWRLPLTNLFHVEDVAIVHTKIRPILLGFINLVSNILLRMRAV